MHWAVDAKEHNEIVYKILTDRKLTRLVKSKSMLTEECHLNPYLEARGIEVVDSDLGERIVQFRKEPPNRIVLPAIHLKREDIGELFHIKLGTDKGASDPKYLTEAALWPFARQVSKGGSRSYRRKFRHRRIGWRSGLHQ